MTNFGCSKFIPVFLGKIVRKIWNAQFWLFQIYTSLFGKNLEHPFLAVPNLHQSFGKKLLGKIHNANFGCSKFILVFLGKLLEKNWNTHFWPFQIYTSLFGKNCQKKFGTPIFGCSKFILVFLRKIVGKNLECAFLVIPNLYQSLLGKIVRKNSECPILAVLNLYQSFWEKLLEKIWKVHFWLFQIYTSLFGKNCWKKFGKSIFGCSKFIPVFLGKIVGKNLESPFLAVPNFF